jgi:hypothetical protein
MCVFGKGINYTRKARDVLHKCFVPKNPICFAVLRKQTEVEYCEVPASDKLEAGLLIGLGVKLAECFKGRTQTVYVN